MLRLLRLLRNGERTEFALRVVTVIFHSENLSFNENLVSRFIRSVSISRNEKNIVRINNFSTYYVQKEKHINFKGIKRERFVIFRVTLRLYYSSASFSDS